MPKHTPRHDSLLPTKATSHQAAGGSLIPAPEEAPPDDAQSAYTATEPELVVLPEDQIETRRVDAATAAGRATHLADTLHADTAMVARFRKVAASGEFSMRSLDGLRRYALALWYAAYMQGTMARQGPQRIPAATKAKARSLRARMQRVARHHYDQDAQEGPTVRNLVQRRGDRGMVQALVGLADLYARHPAVVSSDQTHYRATDEPEARALAQEMLVDLDGLSNPWELRTSQAWTLLVRAYDDVCDTGHWMLRKTPAEAERRFPTLVSEVRAHQRARGRPSRRAKKTVDATKKPA